MKPSLAFAFLLLAACSSTGRGAPKAPADLREELLVVDRAFCAYAQEHPLSEAFRAYLAEGATSMPLGKPFLHGRDAIAASLEGTPVGERLAWTPRYAETSVEGDLGYTYGTWEYRIPAAGGEPLVRRGKYVTIWKRQKDGAWKAIFDGGNTLDE